VKKSDVESIIEDMREDAKEDVTVVLWLRTNLDVLKLVAAWGKMHPEFIGGQGSKVPKKPKEKWLWLWRNFKYDLREWLRLAGIVNQRYGAYTVDRIINLRLVFPDGTLPIWVTDFLSISALAVGKDKK
jgi:hypothetical protein